MVIMIYVFVNTNFLKIAKAFECILEQPEKFRSLQSVFSNRFCDMLSVFLNMTTYRTYNSLLVLNDHKFVTDFNSVYTYVYMTVFTTGQKSKNF